jgi:hypothetical protein
MEERQNNDSAENRQGKSSFTLPLVDQISQSKAILSEMPATAVA